MAEPLPKVSIIIPCYNDGKYLNDAIKSVLNQNYQNIEIIVVDDGSEDEATQKLLKEINRPPVHVFFKAHAGVSDARNYAVSKATGDYILPLDADDLLGESFLNEAVPVLNNSLSVKVVKGNELLFGKRKGLRKLPEFNMETLLGQNVLPTTSLFRKTDFFQTQGFNANMKESFEDWDFWLSLLETGGEVRSLDVVARYYRVRDGSRNFSLTNEHLKRLRWQIYQNHKSLYAKYFFDPMKSFEYDLLLNSREYKLGKRLLKPIRILLGKFQRKAKAS